MSNEERNLIRRINRVLQRENQVLRVARPRWISSLGNYFIEDTLLNTIAAWHCDPEEVAKELGIE